MGGCFLATTWLKPLKNGAGRSLGKALFDVTSYGKNPDKTDDERLVTGYMCDPKTVDGEWLLSKRQYEAATGLRLSREHNVIAYHLEQSFVAGEVEPEEANQIGRELAEALTKGNFSYIVCTHIDKAHCHNHIYFNSVSLDSTRKFRNPWRSTFLVRRLSDKLCVEHGLSIVENPQPNQRRKHKWIAEREPSYQEQLRWAIDDAIAKKPESFNALLKILEEQGYRVKQGKHITFCAPGQSKGTRLRSLKGDYTEEAIRERIAGKRVVAPDPRRGRWDKRDGGIMLLKDIPEIIRAGKGSGYERWAKLFNIQQMSRALVFLKENGLERYEDLEKKVQASKDAFYDTSKEIRHLEAKMKSNGDLQKHIVNYSKTRDIYAAYRKAGYSKKFRAEHEREILLHQEAKHAFDAFDGEKIPSVAVLRSEYAEMLAQKKKLNTERNAAKNDMRELLAAKANIDTILGLTENQGGQKTRDVER